MVEVLPLGVKVWLKYLGNCSVVMLYTTKQRPLFGFRPSWYLWPDHRKGSDESKRWRVCSVSSWCILGDFNGKSEQQIVFPNLQNIWKYSQFETKRRASWGTKNENVDTKCTELVPNNCFVSSCGTDTTALYTQPHYYAFYPVSEDVVSPTMNAAEFKHRKPCALYELVV